MKRFMFEVMLVLLNVSFVKLAEFKIPELYNLWGFVILVLINVVIRLWREEAL